MHSKIKEENNLEPYGNEITNNKTVLQISDIKVEENGIPEKKPFDVHEPKIEHSRTSKRMSYNNYFFPMANNYCYNNRP